MRVLSHPRVRSPLGFAASTWFSRTVVLPQDRTRFIFLAHEGCGQARVTAQLRGRRDLRPRWSAAPQSRGRCSLIRLRHLLPLQKTQGEKATKGQSLRGRKPVVALILKEPWARH